MLPDEYTPDELQRREHIRVAEGYAELGMFPSAWDELAFIPGSLREDPDVWDFELTLLMREHRWHDALAKGAKLCRECPDAPRGFLHVAYCMHELGNTPEALRTLRQGPESLQEMAVYHYNMGCYLAVMGETGQAREFLQTAFAMDDALKESAKCDPDLASIDWSQEH
jgi:tetratricopeptide (TPR) repeat protein